MANSSPLFYFNIDKLSFNFDNRLTVYTTNESFTFEPCTTSYSAHYHQTISVFHEGNYFGYFFHKNKDYAFNSQFKVTNKALYTTQYHDIIEEMFEYLNITQYSMALLELAVNTNFDLVSKWYTYFNNDSRTELLEIHPNYFEHVNTTSFKRRNNTMHNHDSVYIKKKRSAIQMRIENKTVEIQTKIERKEIDKTYILDAYATYLDVNKDIFRMEMTLDFKKLRAQNHRHCYSKVANPFETITKRVFNSLSTYKQNQYHLVDSQIPKTIPLSLLLDQDFLFSFFAHYSIFNYTKVMGNVKPKLLKLSLLQPIKQVYKTSTITQYGGVDDKIIKYHQKTMSIVKVDLNIVPALPKPVVAVFKLDDFFK